MAGNQSDVYVRWSMGPTDAVITYPGWNIDDVRVVGSGVSEPATGDFQLDCDVDFGDFALFALAWQTDSAGPAWNPDFDISVPPDNVINEADLGVFPERWLYSANREDTTPPVPDPMGWASAPHATGEDSILMAAATAADPRAVEYYFKCDSGGHDSNWQDSPVYEDGGLQAGTEYTYSVRARDKSVNRNATGWSVPASSTTTVSGGCTPRTMHVASILCEAIAGTKGHRYGQVTVDIRDNCAQPVANARVTGIFSGDFSGRYNQTTDAGGTVLVTTNGQVKNPSYGFCVIDLTHEILAYDPNDNIETCDSY
ncbi:MAG: hypothetical protein ACYTEQ_14830 [Planctomycetota bacterium]